jgi:hypothetical protein
MLWCFSLGYSFRFSDQNPVQYYIYQISSVGYLSCIVIIGNTDLIIIVLTLL